MRWPKQYKRHRWFAWHPVLVMGGRKVWLEVVNRFWQTHWRKGWWEYEAIDREGRE